MKEFPRPSINKKKLTFPHGIQAINNIDEIIHEIINGNVRLNGNTEIQRGKKVFPGDFVEYKDNTIKVIN